jgi:SAM-dependent methyltransferase
MANSQNIQSFQDNARSYAESRPHYPRELFAYLAGLCSNRRAAWDCATGNGQAALALTQYFNHVEASDISPAQVGVASQAPNLMYSVQDSRCTDFPDHCFDLITVAQALHWFAEEDFFKEADRVLKPGGVLAAWGYAGMNISPPIDAMIHKELYPLLEDYWSEGNREVARRYSNLPFPYPQLPGPRFIMATVWGPEELLGYIGSWSAVHRIKSEIGVNPLEAFAPKLMGLWPRSPKGWNPMEVTFDFFLKHGKKGQNHSENKNT